MSEPKGEERYCRDCWDKKIAVEEIVAREFALKRYIRAHSAEKYLVYHSTQKRPCGQLIVVDDGYDLFLTMMLYPNFAWDEAAYHLEGDPEGRTFAELLVDVVDLRIRHRELDRHRVEQRVADVLAAVVVELHPRPEAEQEVVLLVLRAAEDVRVVLRGAVEGQGEIPGAQGGREAHRPRGERENRNRAHGRPQSGTMMTSPGCSTMLDPGARPRTYAS